MPRSVTIVDHLVEGFSGHAVMVRVYTPAAEIGSGILSSTRKSGDGRPPTRRLTFYRAATFGNGTRFVAAIACSPRVPSSRQMSPATPARGKGVRLSHDRPSADVVCSFGPKDPPETNPRSGRDVHADDLRASCPPATMCSNTIQRRATLKGRNGYE